MWPKPPRRLVAGPRGSSVRGCGSETAAAPHSGQRWGLSGQSPGCKGPAGARARCRGTRRGQSNGWAQGLRLPLPVLSPGILRQDRDNAPFMPPRPAPPPRPCCLLRGGSVTQQPAHTGPRCVPGPRQRGGDQVPFPVAWNAVPEPGAGEGRGLRLPLSPAAAGAEG